MADGRRKVPVAAHHGGVGIVSAEHAVVHAVHPDIALILRPAGQHLRAGDHRAQRLLRAVDDARVLAARVAGIHILAINARRDDDLIACHCDLRRVVDVTEGHGLGTVAIPGGADVDIINHFKSLPSSVHNGVNVPLINMEKGTKLPRFVLRHPHSPFQI